MIKSSFPPSFAILVATHLREIARDLDGATVSPVSAAGEPAPRPPGLVAPPLLPVASAERLASGSLVFPPAMDGAGWQGEPAWHVFSHRPAQQGAWPLVVGLSFGQVVFAQAGVIGGALGDDAFIALAYDIILQRTPDPDGHAAYRQTLQSGRQTRHGVLRDLAGSAEAGASGRLLVILPGDWLTVGGVMNDVGEGLPDAVRVDLRELAPALPLEPDLAIEEPAQV